jgi:hypothetical protein
MSTRTFVLKTTTNLSKKDIAKTIEEFIAGKPIFTAGGKNRKVAHLDLLQKDTALETAPDYKYQAPDTVEYDAEGQEYQYYLFGLTPKFSMHNGKIDLHWAELKLGTIFPSSDFRKNDESSNTENAEEDDQEQADHDEEEEEAESDQDEMSEEVIRKSQKSQNALQLTREEQEIWQEKIAEKIVQKFAHEAMKQLMLELLGDGFAERVADLVFLKLKNELDHKQSNKKNNLPT